MTVGKVKENSLDKEEHKIDYDDLLTAAGEQGCYQWILFTSMFPFYAFGVFVYFGQMFMTQVSPNHWCRIPGLENLTDMQRRDLGVPKDNNSRFGYSQCKMYDVDWINVLATGQKPNQTWPLVSCQYGWEYNYTEIPYPTIGSDYEWVCEKSSYQATAQSIFFVGSIFGGLIFGYIADHFGRLPAIIISCVVGCVGGLASTFTRTLVEFSATRFVVGMAYNNCMMLPYLLMLEYVAPKYRTLFANLSFALFYAAFAVIMPWIVLVCNHWKTISLVTSLPLALAVLAKLFLPESPRWLLSKGRVEEAIEKVLVIGRFNKKEVPEKLIQQFKSSIAIIKEGENHSFLEIFRRPIIRKMYILVCLEYMCCSIVFDGLVRCIGQLEYDFFISFSIISFTEFPSVILIAFIMDYLGRKWLCIVFMVLTSIFCYVSIFVNGIQTMVMAFLARFALNMCFSAVMQWAPEILPTPVRGSGLSLIYIVGYTATFVSPYIIYLKEYKYWLPLVVIGTIAAFGILIPFGLPETAMKGMPQTFDESEDLDKNQRLWTLPFLESRRQKKTQKGQIN